MKAFKEWLTSRKDGFYAIFRVAVGLLFVQHGMQKLFGMLGGTQVNLMSIMGLAGTIEFFGGLLVAFGLITRIAAFFSLANMVGAQIQAHLPKGWIPIQNGGELSILFLVSFLLILVYGSKEYSLHNYFWGKD